MPLGYSGGYGGSGLIAQTPVQVPQEYMAGQEADEGLRAKQQQTGMMKTEQQLQEAKLAETNYQMKQQQTTQQGEDAYSKGTDSPEWQQFKKDNGAAADDINDNHEILNSKKTLLQMEAIKAHAGAVGSSIINTPDRDSYSKNYKSIQALAGDNLPMPDPTSFKDETAYDTWRNDFLGRAAKGTTAASASGKFVQDRIDFIKKYGANSPEVQELDKDHQAYLDKMARGGKTASPTGVIPPSATKALTANLSKLYPNLSDEDRQSMIAVAGSHYIARIKSGEPTDQAMTNAMSDVKSGLSDEKGFISDTTNAKFDPKGVQDIGGTKPSAAAASYKVGDTVDVKGGGKLKVTKVVNGQAYVMHNGKERPINP